MLAKPAWFGEASDLPLAALHAIMLGIARQRYPSEGTASENSAVIVSG
jgi:hypothetical protein